MTQSFNSIDPSVPGGDTGSSQATKLNDWKTTLLSMHSGSARPSYVQAGTMWRDTTGTPWLIKFYDGAQDILLWEINPSTHAITKTYLTPASNAAVLAGVLAGVPIDPVGLQSRIASVAQYRARTAGYILTSDVVADALNEVTIPDAATIALDLSTFVNGRVTMTVTGRLIGLPTNQEPGWGGYIAFVQGGAGNMVPTFEVGWQFGGKIAPTFSTAAGAVDMLEYRCLPGGDVYGALNNDVGRP